MEEGSDLKTDCEDKELKNGDPTPLTMEEQDMEDQMERDKHK